MYGDTITVYQVKRGQVILDSFSTTAWLTDENAKKAARNYRDKMNSNNLLAPCTIVRCYRRSTAKPL